MMPSLQEELFKFTHQKIFVGGILTLLLLMSYSALTIEMSTTQLIFEFGAVQWIPIIVIAVGSAFFAMEYQHHTILILLYKTTNKWQIYLAKLLVVWVYSMVLILIAALFTVILKFLLVGQQYAWLAPVIDHQTRLALLLGNSLGTLVYALFIVTLAFMLIMLLRLNAAVIGVGLSMGFMGAGFSVALMKSFASLVPIIRWNPLNMIFVTQQLANPPYAAVSHLSNGEIIGGNIIYAIIFTILGYYLFKHRRI